MSDKQLPYGWVEATIAEIADVNPKKIDAAPETVAGFVPMSHAPTSFSDNLEFEEKYWSEIKKSYTNFREHDVLVAKVTPCFENGKAAIVKGLPNKIGAGSSEFYVIRPAIQEISSRFLFSIVKSYKFLSEGAANMTGAVGLRRVPRSFVETFPVLVPPLAEQKAIADKLDALLAQVEITKARLERIPEILKTFRHSVLAAAVSGKLTEEWRVAKGIVWQKLLLEDIGEVKGGKRLPKGDELVEQNTGFPYIRAGQLKNGTVINTDDARSKQLYLRPETQAQISRYTVNAGDLYITIVGASIGDAGVIPEHCDGANLTENAAKITAFKKPLISEFVSFWLRSHELQDLIKLEIKSGAQGKLALKRIKELPVPYTDISEQAEIVRRVEELFTFAESIEQKTNAALERVNKLTQSILAKAFRGELTAKWREANPELISGENSAVEVLAKIKTERAKLNQTKKG